MWKFPGEKGLSFAERIPHRHPFLLSIWLWRRGSPEREPVPLHGIKVAPNFLRTIPTKSPASFESFSAMKLNSLEDLLVHELKDLYSAEKQLLKALPKMAKAATNEELKAGFEKHLKETEGHAKRLEKISESMGKAVTGHKCVAMEGLIEEGSELIEEDADEAVRDAGLIGAAQRVEHYEIAGYGTARALASRLGLDDVAKLLGETLEEEKATDVALTEIAESAVNEEASRAQ